MMQMTRVIENIEPRTCCYPDRFSVIAMATLKKKEYTNSTLVAVALQDHISRQYSLETSIKPASSGTHKQRHTNKRKCTPSTISVNTNSDSRERLHPVSRLPRQHEKTAQVEYVLDKPHPPLTLAQRMGLVDAPQPLLRECEWKKVKVQSSIRHDSSHPCSICQEEFGLDKQALLSCSHVFHLTCLKSFEKFSRSKKCPLCRKQDYQTRVIYDGAQYYRHKAATIIQSTWRGYIVRKWYLALREKFPPNNPILRKKHFEKKFSQVTDQLIRSCDQDTRGAESVILQADVAMETSRNAMRLLEAHCTELTSNTVDWKMISIKAKEHITSDCPVCLVALCTPYSGNGVHRPLALLSCGHLLHCSCIEALENFSLDTIYLCPLCRSVYQRIELTADHFSS